jgi:hypothetical protein
LAGVIAPEPNWLWCRFVVKLIPKRLSNFREVITVPAQLQYHCIKAAAHRDTELELSHHHAVINHLGYIIHISAFVYKKLKNFRICVFIEEVEF